MTTRFYHHSYWIPRFLGLLILILALGLGMNPQRSRAQSKSYAIVDTGQTVCYNSTGTAITCPAKGSAFYGQDAQYTGNAPSYTNNGNGTITDNITGLIWQQTADSNGDGTINSSDKLTYTAAGTYCENLVLGSQTDWQLPSIKQLYSLIKFNGTDPSGYTGTNTSSLIPFIDTTYFKFAYGDTSAGERIIDAQYASSNLYVSNTAGDGGSTLFGVNFADGRIKGYGLTLNGQDKTFFVMCVRNNSSYGVNNFTNNGNSTITDSATGLLWAQNDSAAKLNWEEALAWVETQNTAKYLGYSDWRLPNAKELQSLVDYTRSPDKTSSAAINALFNVTGITNEAGNADFPFYWSSTTHVNWTTTPGAAGVYVTFGRAMGYMNSTWVDVHGAGAQRSDPKAGDPADYPTGNGPQGDAIRIYNYVRLVRDAGATSTTPTAVPNTTPTATSIPSAPSNSKTYLPLVVKSVSAPSNTPTSNPTSLPQTPLPSALPSPTLLPNLTPIPTLLPTLKPTILSTNLPKPTILPRETQALFPRRQQRLLNLLKHSWWVMAKAVDSEMALKED